MTVVAFALLLNLVLVTKAFAQASGITTFVAANPTGTTPESGGTINSDGGCRVTARGVCWSTLANPTVALATKTVDGIGSGSFQSHIAGLALATTYHLRAYATDAAGTAYGNDISFVSSNTPSPSTPAII